VHRNTPEGKSQNRIRKAELRLLTRRNVRFALKNWLLSPEQVSELKRLTEELHVSIAMGDLSVIHGKWYVTHAGLLRIARRAHCSAIRVRPLRDFSDPFSGRWVFRAVVHKSGPSNSFVGYGDADPSNVSLQVRGAEMRVAETRAVNRALRKAYGIGLCSVEELGWTPRASGSPQPNHQNGSFSRSNGNGQSAAPRLRDRLCLLIREHQLDPSLVKAYAADYCGTPALHNASREQVQAFITHLTERATKDRAALLCHLNSFAKPQEVTL
jgi:hypothetical protein